MRTGPPLCNLKTLHRSAPQVALWGRRFMNNYQNLPERIEKIRAHLKTKRGRRDYNAMLALAGAQKLLSKSCTFDKLNAILREYYNAESAHFLALQGARLSNPFFRTIAGGSGVQPVYFEPISFLKDDK